MIEVMFAIRKDGFKDHPAVVDGLDLVEESDQITHLIALDEEIDPGTGLDVFKVGSRLILSRVARMRRVRRMILMLTPAGIA
jgi:hypothetical protein